MLFPVIPLGESELQGSKMTGFQNRKGQDLQKPIPGCMGRMINMFDLSAGVSRTKLLTEKPHQDVSSIHTNGPDSVNKRAIENFAVQEDKKITGKKYLSKKSGGTPMKMLIAQEMSREPQSEQKPSNVVAKLMGLDALPAQQSVLTTNWSSQESYSHKSLSGEPRGHWQHEDHSTDKHPQNKRNEEKPADKRMALVHQKFTEAKRLATDEKLLQSKEFQEALEVLSSNRDLFLKFLEQPNALFAKQLPESQGISPAPQPRRITVLKPSKAMEPRGEVQERKLLHPAVEDVSHDIKSKWKSSSNPKYTVESIAQPTRIVVLKPDPGMCHEMKAGVTSKRLEVPTEATEHSKSSEKDELAISLTPSNGYFGDESSFTRSENEYIKEECDNVSDSESVTPTSRHSWDYSFRLSSPLSVSSFSRGGRSSEPSVITEAKKRLSERLAMVSSAGNNQEDSRVQRSSSTLGEMLAIAKVRKEGADDLANSSRKSFVAVREQDALTKECDEASHRNLARSKSLPVSSSVYKDIESRDGVFNTAVSRPITKSKSGMSTFTGKVSSLFFSRIKKAGREKPPLPSCFLGLNQSETYRVDAGYTSSTPSKGGKLGASMLKDPRESQDQPSPSSVLEPPFDDDASSSICLPSPSIISQHPQALSRSPPIGSISRTLTWDNPREAARQDSLKLHRVLSRECEEQERYLLIQKLLSCANLLDDSAECSTVLSRWHSLDSPLDPGLLDEFLDRKEEEAKCRVRRSSQRLLFDCVNAALLTIGESVFASSYPWSPKCQRGHVVVAEEVVRLLKDWFSSDRRGVSGEPENRNVVVENLVKREIAGRGWTDSMFREVDEFSKEISERMLDELVDEAVADLTDGLL